DARPEQHAIVPVADARHDQQPPRPAQGTQDQVAAGGVLAAPGAGVHPIVHTAIAMRADVLEPPVRPLLAAAAPGAELHRVHRSAGAAPATPLELEPLRGLQGLGARILVADVVTAPGTEGVAVRHHPTAVAAFRPRSALEVAPLQAAAAVGAKIPEALHFRGAG